ncbi:hypothetical protein CHU92_13390 [Flavobacterium cyanobacteriorum]|uniref:Uncharacterized protein n=1 Tax=Flavobacterium cyanobacteriorum TaxID=2022802 RepID=A0A255YVC9_9FLAO|nr:hypothetical protein [Flavobacterium cyanobacteriorum]OYQ33131.1 hypothetical protein CHU92_13390 [Flavobacterium cyanobacteriorum]
MKTLSFIKAKHPELFWFSMLCLGGALLCVALINTTSVVVAGVNAWLKPFKFFTSVALLSLTAGYFLQFLPDKKQGSLYSWSMIVLLSFELLLIVFQAARGKASHFNISTPADKLIFNLMALAITLFMVHTSYIAIRFFMIPSTTGQPLVLFAFKLSLIILIIFAFEGFAMGAMLKHTVGAPDGGKGLPIVNWSSHNGDLRIAHFLGIHAIQIVPLASAALARTKRDVVTIAFAYLIIVTATFLRALSGKPLF